MAIDILTGPEAYNSFFFSSRRRHTRSLCDWSSDVCSSDLPAGLGGGIPVGRREAQIWVLGRLVRVVDAGEAPDLPRAGLGVEALGVAGLAHLDRRVDEDLDERQPRGLVDGARPAAVGPAGAGDRDERHHSGVVEQAAPPTDAADL